MKPKNVLPFVSKGKKKAKDDSAVLDHGNLGTMEYEVYKRGVIHIFEPNGNLRFKKDTQAFEDELEKMKFSDLKEGKSLEIKGSGDNPNLIFTRRNGDISLSLEEKGFPTLKKLKRILKGG